MKMSIILKKKIDENMEMDIYFGKEINEIHSMILFRKL